MKVLRYLPAAAVLLLVLAPTNKESKTFSNALRVSQRDQDLDVNEVELFSEVIATQDDK